KKSTNTWEGNEMASRAQTPNTETIVSNGHHATESAENRVGNAKVVVHATAQPAAAPQPQTKAETVPAKPERRLIVFLRRNRRAVLLTALIVVAAIGTESWLYMSSYESTDDAQIDGHLHPISARINGTIVRVNPQVEDNHYVEAGTVLAEI